MQHHFFWVFVIANASLSIQTWYNILFIDPLPSHEHLHFVVERERPIIFPEAVEKFEILEFLMFVAH